MKKSWKIEDVDCAVCAGKMQDAIAALPGVTFASVNFLAERLTIECDEAQMEDILNQAEKICRKIDPDCRIHR